MALEVSVNYLAVIVAAVASMIVGSIWYGPLFGKTWMKLAGYTKKDLKKMSLSPKQARGFGFVVALVMAYVLSFFVDYVGATTIAAGAQLAFWIWLGFIATIQIGAVIWEGKSLKLFLLHTVSSLISLIVMAAILAVWA